MILIGLQLGYRYFRYFQKKMIHFKAAIACSDLLKFSGEIDVAKKRIKGAYFWLSFKFLE